MKNHEITIYDIAALAGVSPATVSRVINHPDQVKFHTRQKIYTIMEQYNFTKRTYYASTNVIDSASTLDTYLICLPSLSNAFYGDIIEGASSAATNFGCQIFVNSFIITEFNVNSFLFMIKKHQISGVIFMTAMSDALLSKLQNSIPIIQCSEYNETYTGVSFVSVDDVETEYKATLYALDTGHSKIAFMTSSLQYHYAQRRLCGFQMAAHARKISVPNDWIIQLPSIDFSIAYNAALRLFSKPNFPNAIICISDTYAAACIKAATHLHLRIPEDLIVIGFDNIDISTSSTPSITTINQPRFQLGYTALELLLSEIKLPLAPKQQIFLPTELIIRDSTRIGNPD